MGLATGFTNVSDDGSRINDMAEAIDAGFSGCRFHGSGAGEWRKHGWIVFFWRWSTGDMCYQSPANGCGQQAAGESMKSDLRRIKKRARGLVFGFLNFERRIHVRQIDWQSKW